MGMKSRPTTWTTEEHKFDFRGYESLTYTLVGRRGSYTTTVQSNGSKWGGQAPDPLVKLFEVLDAEPLDPSFEILRGRVNAFTSSDRKGTRFHGNFYTVSHVFDVHTDDPDVCASLTAAIRSNVCALAYREARSVRREQNRITTKHLSTQRRQR